MYSNAFQDTSSNLPFRQTYRQLAKCLPRIRHLSLPRARPQLQFFYPLSSDPFASIIKLF